MIRRIYVHNFRCLDNFELSLASHSSVLLLGRNGSGKTAIGMALKVLQAIGRGTNRVRDLVSPEDLGLVGAAGPMRFEIEAELAGRVYVYSIAFEFPTHFRELRVKDETFTVDGAPILSRELAQVMLSRGQPGDPPPFRIDWHLVALAVLQEQRSDQPLTTFRQWLAAVLILRPVPSLARGESDQNNLPANAPDIYVENIGEWFSTLLATTPAVYKDISEYLMAIMPDFSEIKNAPWGSAERRRLTFRFRGVTNNLELPLEALSDGEKCFVIFALTIATAKAGGPLLCFWDEPDNHLTLDEVGHSVMALRRAFRDSGQLIATSHHPEAISRFSDENTFYLSRHSHLEPTIITPLENLRGKFSGGLVDALIRGDVAA
jgi:predicted ATPase